MKVLIVDDEFGIREVIREYAEVEGYEVVEAENGIDAIKIIEGDANIDIMVLDIMMPKKDGVSALKEMRAAGNVTPALFLTAKSEVDDRVVGLDSGADDYIAKPFAMKELVARIRSLTRRAGSYTPKEIKFGSVTLDTEEQAIYSENSIRLAKKESRLMELFMLNAGKELSTEEIYNTVWRDEDGNSDVVWVYVSYLNSKLKAIDANVEILGEEGGSFTMTISNG